MMGDFNESEESAFDSMGDDDLTPMPPMVPPMMQSQAPMPVLPMLPAPMPVQSMQQAASVQQPQPQPQRQTQRPQMARPTQHVQMRPMMSPFAVLPLPPGLGQAPVEENFFQRKIGGLPVWAWGAIAVVGGGAAYFAMRDDGSKSPSKAKLKSNDSDAEPEKRSKKSSSEWGPSRGRFIELLNRKFGSKFVRVYDDADVAKADLKTVSPLVNAKAKPGFKIDKTFETFCKSEGLHPVAHEDDEVGFYPADGTARGREWEEYVDLLRDDGQTA